MPSSLAQKRHLVDEINSLLEQDNASLTSIVRKAVRLAEICNDLEHRLLLDIHLDGVDLSGGSGARIEKWSDSSRAPEWDITDAFYKDRNTAHGCLPIPLDQIESRLEQIPEERRRMAAKGNSAAVNQLLEAKMIYADVLGRIRNRVGAFVRQVEREVSKEEETERQKNVSAGVPQSPARGANDTSYRKLMPLKGWVILAVIIATVALGIFYIIFVRQPSNPVKPIRYSGRVIDVSSQQAIGRAKVSFEVQGIPQIYYTDSEGVFYLEVPSEISVARIRVEASGYEVFDRNVSLSRTGIEDVRLMPVKSPQQAPTASPIAPAGGNPGTSSTVNKPLKRKPRADTASELERRRREALRDLDYRSPTPQP